MIGLHHFARFHLINDHSHLGVCMDSHTFRPIFWPAGYEQGNMVDLVLLAEVRRGSLQPLEIVTEEVDEGANFLVAVFLNDSVDLLDQTGQAVVERPSEDEDDQTAVCSVIPEPRANWVAVFRTATFYSADVE